MGNQHPASAGDGVRLGLSRVGTLFLTTRRTAVLEGAVRPAADSPAPDVALNTGLEERDEAAFRAPKHLLAHVSDDEVYGRGVENYIGGNP